MEKHIIIICSVLSDSVMFIKIVSDMIAFCNPYLVKSVSRSVYNDVAAINVKVNRPEHLCVVF